MSELTPLMQRVNRKYEKNMYSPMVEELYEGSDFHNLGYWTSQTLTAHQAAENLMSKLLAMIPKKGGKILDIACGKGATTRFLLNYYPAQDVTGIDISAKHLTRSRQNAPGCTFLQMNATDLLFDDETFDAIICVEAAVHFETRKRFFREAFRVLRPGGSLVLSDILIAPWAAHLAKNIPIENIIQGPSEYKKICWRTGFRDVTIVDATRECLDGFFDYGELLLQEKILAGQVPWSLARRFKRLSFIIELSMEYYLLVSAIKA